MNLSKEQLKMHWKEIQAWADGKQIQYRIDDDCEWTDIEEPSFFTDGEYRVKPEPILIPFDYSDAEFLIGKAIKAKDNSCINIITKVSRSSGIVLVSYTCSFQKLLNLFTFLDGSPCGKPKV
ncbi:MAG: hypothetical protein KA234_00315 [Saprospiraceae bacterium]|nr:hypothetical protein [Saprospiraceae bacterium]